MTVEYNSLEEYVEALLEFHDENAVRNFLAIYNGRDGVGLMRVKIGDVETSAIAVQRVENGPVQLLFVAVTDGMIISTLAGEVAKKTHFDDDGNVVKPN